MVAHNKNYKPAPKPHSKPARNPRYAEPKDEVSHLHESDLICELADPSNSLEDICAAQGISLEALSLWMARPDVAQRLDLVQTTAMNRARFIGRLTLPTAAQSAANIINAHKLRPQKPTIDSAFDSDLHRANETMLKAARFLQRLTAEPAPRRASNPSRKSEAPSPTEGTPESAGRAEAKAFDEVNEATGGTLPVTERDIGGERTVPTSTGPNNKTNSNSSPREPAEFNQRGQTPQSGPHRKSNRRSRRNATPRSTKARSRKPSRPSTQSRISASAASIPTIPASSSPQPKQAPPRRSPEISAPPPRARAPSPVSRAASG
jgi:hypothetical protein